MQWAKKAWEAVKGFFKKIGNGLKRSYEALKTRLANFGNWTKSKYKLDESTAFKLFLNKEGKLITSEGEFVKQIENTLGLGHVLTDKFIDSTNVDQLFKTVSGKLEEYNKSKDVKVFKDIVGHMMSTDNNSVVGKFVEDVKQTSAEFIGGKIAYVAGDGDNLRGGIHKPDVDYSGNPQEVVALNKNDLLNYSEKLCKLVFDLDKQSAKVDAALNQLDKFKDKFKDANDADKASSKLTVSIIKTNLSITSKLCQEFSADAANFIKYGNKLIAAETAEVDKTE